MGGCQLLCSVMYMGNSSGKQRKKKKGKKKKVGGNGR